MLERLLDCSDEPSHTEGIHRSVQLPPAFPYKAEGSYLWVCRPLRSPYEAVGQSDGVLLGMQIAKYFGG